MSTRNRWFRAAHGDVAVLRGLRLGSWLPCSDGGLLHREHTAGRPALPAPPTDTQPVLVETSALDPVLAADVARTGPPPSPRPVAGS